LIKLYWIGKEEKDSYSEIEKRFLKISSKYAKVESNPVWNRDIQKQQNGGNVVEIENSYRNVLEKYLQKDSYNIILDPLGKELDTVDFSKILKENSKVSFFIGGAYGFNDKFRKEGDLLLRVSKLTMSHKVARVVLLEQIYRGLTINSNHPYHK
jgi:23S rRNA (pseudouridine1915-N3)-methyltransferase